MSALARALDGVAEGFAHAGLAVAVAGTETVETRSASGLGTFGPDTFFRAASISKIVTGQTCAAVFETLPGGFGTRASTFLGAAVEGPTLGQLLAHTSGLWDEDGYAVPKGETLDRWLRARGGAIRAPDAPGTVMRYCNLGYLLAAAAAERATGERFDRLAARHVLGPLGVRAGFNWAGLGAAERAARVPTYRRDDRGAFLAQIDADVAADGIVAPDGAAVPEEAGGMAHRLSPQGGLRITLRGALALGRAIPDLRLSRLHRAGDCPADDPAGLMQDYGAGLMFLDLPSLYPRPLVGHFANSYGFCGGTWFDPGRDAAFAYALNGLPLGDEDDALRPAERALFSAVAEHLG